MRENFSFPKDSKVCYLAKACSSNAMSWYKSLLYYCNSYYYNNRDLAKGKPLDARSKETTEKLNRLLKECNSTLPPIGSEGALVPRPRELARCLFYERVILMDRNYDIRTFRHITEAVQAQWEDAIAWEENGCNPNVRPKLPRSFKADYMDYSVDRRALYYDGKSLKVTVDRNSFFVNMGNKKSVYPNWVDVKFDDYGVHIQVDYETKRPTYDFDKLDLGERNGVVCAADAGLNNLLTMCNNVGVMPIAINGRLIKHFNRGYNIKIRGINNNEGLTPAQRDKMLRDVETSRIRSIDKIFDGACKKAVAYCIQCNAKELFLGYTDMLFHAGNVDGFDSSFRAVPFQRLLDKLASYMADAGIYVKRVSDYETSLTSFFDGEPADKSCSKPERRIYRGIFITDDDLAVNSDLNAAYQIMMKASPNCITEPVRVYLYPLKINPVKVELKKSSRMRARK